MARYKKPVPRWKTAVAAPAYNLAEEPNPIRPEMDDVRCSICGCRGSEHRQVDGRCPASSSWAMPKPFPSLTHSGDSEEADRKIYVAIDRYWSGDTVFKARRF